MKTVLDRELMATEKGLEEMAPQAEAFFVESGCCKKACTQLMIAFEEMFVNVVNYAYKDIDVSEEDKKVRIILEDLEGQEEPRVRVTFSDRGTPYDPLSKPDPDTTKRNNGGLGIYMVKKSMDAVRYEYRNGQNIFQMEKKKGVGKNVDN